MKKRVILVAGTPIEHSVEYSYKNLKRDFAAKNYNYSIALLKANKNIFVENDYEVEILDFPVSRKMDILNKQQIERILSNSPSVVGFSVYCWNKHIFLNTAHKLKNLDKSLIIIVGGPSVSYEPVETLNENECIDIVVIGDGEFTFSKLLSNDFQKLEQLDGIAFKRNNNIVIKRNSEYVDINNVFSPYLRGDFKPASDTVMIEPSRGCVYRCRFCSWSKGRALNIKRSDLLAEELKWAYKNKYKYINFSDTSINMTNEQLQVIVDSLKSSRVYDKLSFSVFMKYDKLDTDQFKLIEGVKFDEIIIGLESINDNVLKECGKPPFDRLRFEYILERLGLMGNKLTISIITGLPQDSFSGIKKTFEYLEGLIDKYPDFINFVCSFWLAILPGTKFAKDKVRHKFNYLNKGTPYLVSSKYFSKKDLIKVAEYVVEKTKMNNKIFCEEYYIEALENGL